MLLQPEQKRPIVLLLSVTIKIKGKKATRFVVSSDMEILRVPNFDMSFRNCKKCLKSTTEIRLLMFCGTFTPSSVEVILNQTETSL